MRSGEIEGQDILIALFATMIGFFGIGQGLSHLQRFISAKAAAYDIFAVIDREPEIDNLSPEGITPESFEVSTLITTLLLVCLYVALSFRYIYIYIYL